MFSISATDNSSGKENLGLVRQLGQKYFFCPLITFFPQNRQKFRDPNVNYIKL